MYRVDEDVRLSASDLVGHLNCRYVTMLDLAVANGTLAKPKVWDPVLELLAERGALHEQSYVDHLAAQGFDIVSIAGVGVEDDAVAQTLEAMRAGRQIIVQGALADGRWSGRSDVLRRIEKPSQLGAWSYEVIDTKLAKETKGNTVLQLCLYNDLLASSQGHTSEFAYVVAPETGFQEQSFRFTDYAAYYRRVRLSLERAVEEPRDDLYPDPNPHCEICRWRVACDSRRREDDHLSLVAGISKSQSGELNRRGIRTLSLLAEMPLPLQWKPDRGAAQSYAKIREQARIQAQGRRQQKTIYEALPVTAGIGLCQLPLPSEGDIFFDLEGDPFVAGGGLEFLFGYAFETKGEVSYVADWSFSRADEKAAFERFVDFAVDRLRAYPDLHIYHFAPYEPAALKRLMGRYATRENEIDMLLRAGVFVDLYAIVRHGIRASVESYSIKKLEPLYEFIREAPLGDVGPTMAKIQACIELGDFDGISQNDITVVQAYNRDDCISTLELRSWLEGVRENLIGAGADIPRPVPETGEAPEELDARQRRIAELIERLTADVPVDVAERTPEQHARWLLAYILDWHRREEKAVWWEYFRLKELTAEELFDERAAISGLTFLDAVGGTAKAPIHRYAFPAQETELRGGEDLRSLGGDRFGKLESISLEDRTVDVKKRQDTAAIHPAALFAHQVVDSATLADSLLRIGEYVAHQGMDGRGPYRAARDLLKRVGPAVGASELQRATETTLEAAVRLAPALLGVLPVQGPPGAGKTHTGARMIVELAAAGKRIGVTANSHKVIGNLLDATNSAAEETGKAVQCIQKVTERRADTPKLKYSTDNSATLSAIGTSCQVAGGTAWLWAREDATGAVDVLFIDEAAQMSLANVLAVSQAAAAIVLLGDPRQLEQPMQGSHPDGTGVSALDHILGEHITIPSDRGLFLDETWRLHPSICDFTSELFYEGRLQPRPGLEAQGIRSSSRLTGSGLRFFPVAHRGNQGSSPEEADVVALLVAEVMKGNSHWTDRHGVERPMTLEDILIIAPYNAQVFELQERIPGGRIGTVDKFQGQEAPLVFYSMTTSSYDDAPRGMEFLYSANRLNVATSRAKCICVIVGSPLLFEAECRTPRQMQLANAFCRYLELASVVT